MALITRTNVGTTRRVLAAAAAATLCACLVGCSEAPEEKNLRHDQMCRSYGAKPGSPEYIQCRATIVVAEHRRDERASSNAVAVSIMAVGIAAGSAGRR